MPIKANSAAATDVGKIRSNNQDSGYAGEYLFMVADGMGGHAGGDVASAIAAKRIMEADAKYESVEAAQMALQDAVMAANDQLSEAVVEHPELTGMGTTVDALMVVGDEVAIAHIGDSRIYLYRDGELTQITTDHTFVQRLVDSGRITAAEARMHPRRSVLMRVLGDVDTSPELDVFAMTIHDGDRWIICSDGLSDYVDDRDTLQIVSAGQNAQKTADRLVKKTLDNGAPDNVTVVVLDIGAKSSKSEPVIVGSVSQPLAFEVRPSRRTGLIPALRLHTGRVAPLDPSHFEPAADDYLEELIEEDARRARRRRLTWALGIFVVVLALVLGLLGAYSWTQTRYYVGADDDSVVIFQGIQQSVGPFSLSHEYQDTGIPLDGLSFYDRQEVERTISASSLGDARQIVSRLRVDDGSDAGTPAPGETQTPAPTPTGTPTAGGEG
ncbi:protein phosphatase [Paramicrobacterium humi]|uniref:Protein phosphatase n=1 Tax=Paramicrobacterium humi TaxID=640635 RepID=A0A1H4K617_9MICO|nr:Stp1/IreP family PP2C-type Ser/Thr phosphatase [Microbacterium humi]SEB53974.1 protein phosphatase [Microbacterium humi]